MFTIGTQGPRRGKGGAIEKHFAGKWHIITLQESIEYLEHEFLTNRFHVTHYEGCAILFNKDTSCSDIKVTSIHLHDLRCFQAGHCERRRCLDGLTRCHIKGIFSLAATRWQIVLHSVVFAHQQQLCQKKRGIGKKLQLTIRGVMIEEHADLVVGDFDGAAWRRQIGNGNLSIIEEAFAGSDLPMPPDPTPLWGPGAVPGDWADVCGFSQASRLLWKIESTSAWCILHSPRYLGHSAQRIKAAIMRCGCTWPSLTITVTTNREKGMSNGFSSRKDLLFTSPARKEAKQVRTKATVRHRHYRPYEQHGSHEHDSRCTRSRFTKGLVL